MKNKFFVLIMLLVVGGALAVATKLFKPQESTVKPPDWMMEILVRPDSYIKGNPNAPVTIVEFFDPECESCRAIHKDVQQLLKEYEGRVRLVYRYMPFHANSTYAASVLEEARSQGKFDAALDILFEKQPEWGDHHKPRPELLPGYLAPLGIDSGSLSRDVVLKKYESNILRDRDDGVRLLVNATPTFFVNGKTVFNLGYAPLKEAIEKALTAEK